MTEQQARVTFQPYGRAVFVLGGTKIIEAARAGLTINTPCGGAGTSFERRKAMKATKSKIRCGGMSAILVLVLGLKGLSGDVAAWGDFDGDDFCVSGMLDIGEWLIGEW